MSKRILFISSVNPLHGPGRLMLDTYEAMKRGGYEVDFYTQYTVPGHPEIRALCGDGPNLRTRIRSYVFTRMQKPAYYFFYGREERPPVPATRILNLLNGSYDLIYIGFWQGLLSFETVARIHDKFQAPLVLATVDLSVMTGGCHYPHACTRYKQACGHCPGFKHPVFDTFTRHNIRYRERFYDRIKPVILTNSFVSRIFRESRLLRGREIVKVSPVIDDQVFCPRDKAPLRKKFGIPAQKQFILLAGVQNFQDDRKGGRYLVAALNAFYERLSDDERARVLLLSVGNGASEMGRGIRLDQRSMGYVNLDVLAELYALADVFLSPSIEDGGPMMVNQAISCGTPVVSFQIGTALEVVAGKGTGYCARLRDAEDFAAGIYQHFQMTPAQIDEQSKRCRQLALATSSFEACIRSLDHLMEIVGKQVPHR